MKLALICTIQLHAKLKRGIPAHQYWDSRGTELSERCSFFWSPSYSASSSQLSSKMVSPSQLQVPMYRLASPQAIILYCWPASRIESGILWSAKPLKYSLRIRINRKVQPLSHRTFVSRKWGRAIRSLKRKRAIWSFSSFLRFASTRA